MDRENQKYVMVKTDTIELTNGTVLTRIKALIDIGRNVKAGDLGGFIEHEENLNHTDNAWVHNNAQVYGNAQISGKVRVSDTALVSGNASIYGDAQVYGNAEVHGNARISGNARVSDAAWVSGNAQVYNHARVSGNASVHGDAKISNKSIFIQLNCHTICVTDNNIIQIGCESHTIETWCKSYEEIGKTNAYSKENIELYGKFIQFIAELKGIKQNV